QLDILNDRMNRLEKVAMDMQERDDNIYRVIFEAEPVSADIREAGMGGADRYSKLKGFKNSDLIVSTVKKMDELTNKLYVQSKSYDEVFEMAKNKDEMMACIPAIQPISDKYKRRISAFYGYRIHPIYKTKIFHEGIDFSAPVGTDVYASGDGVVVEASRSNYGYGNIIEIDHGYSYTTVYAHLNGFKVREGERVKRGQTIGSVGNSGLSTGPHLHYEVRKSGNRVNPIYFFFNDLNPDDYDEIINVANQSVASRAK
ncbi:MAG: M23 family metallopeptidase, partial [Bacteroidota bacterium]